MNLNSRTLSILLVLGILVATTITYSNHFHNEFHFDDVHTIVNNLYIRDLQNIPKFFTDGTTGSALPANQSYRPVLTTTLALDYKMAGGLSNTLYFHITSFIFFLLQGILMFVLFRHIIKKVSPESPAEYISAFATAWFMLHPACAETINYIIQRGDSLSTFFVVLALVMYGLSPVCKKYYLYLIPVALGCLTKPSALMFAPILVAYSVLFEEELSFTEFLSNKKGALGRVTLVSIASFVVVGALYALMMKMQSASYVEGAFSKLNYRITQPFIMFHVFRSWFAPTELTADTDWTAFTSFADPYVIGGFLFVLAGLYVMFITASAKKTRPIAFGIAWFFLANVPTTIVAFSEVTNDHRMFFPFVGLALAVTWALYLLVEHFSYLAENNPSLRVVFFITLFLGLTGYAYGTYQRNAVWKTDEELWKDVAEKSPKNGRGLMNYGLALMAKGDYAGAEFYYTQALKYSPNYSYLHINMGVLKEALGNKAEAEKYYKQAVNVGAGSPNTYYYYARFLYNSNRKEEAVGYLYTGERMAPADIHMRYLLMDALYDLQRYEELKVVAQKTVQLFPADKRGQDYMAVSGTGKSKLQMLEETAAASNKAEDYLNLSLYYYNATKYQECIDACKKALAVKPDYAAAYNNMCSAYNAMGNYEEGVKACEQALKIQPVFELAKNNLAWARKNLKK
ncbi:MAG TPA: tetratricopeptide repeat protein [Chitinophagales bacterium]|nr:tetratricopeptide repeat protein [Chitinophagales bacterium]